MISLSNPSWINERKQIRVKPAAAFLQNNVVNNPKQHPDKGQLNQQMMQAKQTLADLHEEQKRLMEQTQQEIEAEKQAWQEEKQKYIEAAKKEGYQAGFSLGKSESLTAYKEYLDQANQIIDSAKQDYHTLIEEHEETIMEIAIHTAEKILKQKIDANPELFLSIIKAAIKELKDQSEVALYLHPDQYTFVIQHKEELASLIEQNAKLTCYVSDEIKENGCMIKHPFGQVDVSVDTQLEEIGKVLSELAGEKKQ
ncbi:MULTISPECIES: flagellar assembly protein FliH [Virgibacillus]|uniref:Flagellar assembly protein FliH n=1 Tax=Virgibacillus pantothenticus TaxID=1473 RepID=A0A0L0QNG8_VIRPA|nr:MULTISPECIES: flagellar assembly protein FliH [Virgibacillus]API93886.1 flagellar assembly protein FliH [Virgibacillus sp. 6R]KNE20170.1 hypothetical protein AFK71_17415 [Virgibacillus pantothenticus]MBS7427571.1 flagellar assembly protein FliH [Virgibacillus sp. 19R1-5]MBU8565939.1 flagellar assembly protein FliH [Virgibacillus pantothenticus]MBU8600916.1 flagellar assembly protein FliH [Virgibacillus pantothenticus]